MAGQKIRVYLKSHDHEVIDGTVKELADEVTRIGATAVGPVSLLTEENVFYVIHSFCKYKNGHEYFEMRTHKRLIGIADPTLRAIDTLRRLNLPADVNVETKF